MKSIFRNATEVAKNSIARTHALQILNAGMEAVLTRSAMRRSISRNGSILRIQNQEFDLSNYERMIVVGGGKAAADMAEELEAIVGDYISEGLVTDVVSRKLRRIEVVAGTHPLPSRVNRETSLRMLEMVKRAGEKVLVTVLISGGGSSIMACPREDKVMDVDKLAKITSGLLRSGANISEINTVRKHLSQIAGGQLAAVTYPATLVSLIFSDVVGNDLSVIASGPTIYDETTAEDAVTITTKRLLGTKGLDGASELAKETIREWFVETPKDRSLFSKTHNFLLLDNTLGVHAMKEEAERLGYQTEIIGTTIEGEARMLGKDLVQRLRSLHHHHHLPTDSQGVALIGAGETTVHVTGHGKGGRNQEVALSGLISLLSQHHHNNNKEEEEEEEEEKKKKKKRVRYVIGSVGTDGIDHCEAAGGLIDNEKSIQSLLHRSGTPTTKEERGRRSEGEEGEGEEGRRKAEESLSNNDSFHFLETNGDLLWTGPTGTNVADLFLALAHLSPSPSPSSLHQ